MKNKKRLLTGPYLFWAVAFTIIPLLMIIYYGMTDSKKHFTWSNLAQITTPENLKALPAAFLYQHLSLSASCLSAGSDPFGEKAGTDRLSCADLYSAHVDELSFAHPGMAAASGKQRSDQHGSLLLPSARRFHDQYTRCHRFGHGLRFSAVYGASYL